MIPTYFLELADTNVSKDVCKKYFNDQYPETNSCIELDKQIASIEKDIDDINKRELSGYKECNCFPIIQVPCSPKGDFGCSYSGTETDSNPDYTKGILIRKSSKKFLEQMLITKKNLVALADCRNQIETVRQEETAQVFTDTSAKAETRVLTDTKNKQYLLIGVGAVAVLTVVYLVTRKK